MSLSREQFAFLRRSSPVVAFGALIKDFSAAVGNNYEMTEAFASFQKRFKGRVNTPEDARRLAALSAQGADKLGINVGALPLAISAGLASMYDVAVERLRSSDRVIEPRMFGARAIRTVERMLDIVLLQIGSTSVAALELALADPDYAERLRLRANELKVSFAASQGSFGSCEFCVLVVNDGSGNFVSSCGTEEECLHLGTIIIILAAIWLIDSLVDWFF